MRLLVVGDFHAEQSDLDDCHRLADYIVSLSKEHKTVTLFTGDQYHTHGVISAEVQRFWYDFYKRLEYGSISLVGNHDRPATASSKASAMIAHESDTVVVSEPRTEGGFLFLPYYHEIEDFIAICNKHFETHTVFCHQTFDAAKYENGFYAGNGIEPNLIPQKQIISGHIHTPQEYGKVWYVGAPRWRILSDANTTRAIWYIEMKDDGSFMQKVPYQTNVVCREILHFEEREDGPPPPKYLDPRHEWHIDIYGSAKFVDDRATLYRSMGHRIRTFRTQERQRSVTESAGVEMALAKWLSGFKAARNTPVEMLHQMLKERAGKDVKLD